MGIFICTICEESFKNLNSLRIHSIQKHQITNQKIYIDYVLGGKEPKCLCGCDQRPPFISINKGFSRFISGHHNRVKGKNNFHKNPETHKRAIETQKKNWKEGKYKGWWENKTEETIRKIDGIKQKLKTNKERGKKISEKLKGVPKTEESKIKLSNTQKKRYLENPKLKEDLSKKRIEWLQSESNSKKTKLEKKFESILNILELDFDYQYELHGRAFDYHLKIQNVLIEVDGDFYHCNPNSKHKEIIYETQKLTLKNDNYKNLLCQNHNMTLIRYWEKDINERPEWVISDLKNKLSL